MAGIVRDLSSNPKRECTSKGNICWVWHEIV